MCFRKYLFISLLFFTTIETIAQKTTPFIFDKGFCDFVLGANKDSFRKSIRLVDTFTWKGVTDYTYVHTFNPVYEIAGIKFQEVILTFDKLNRLKQFFLIKIYTTFLFPKHIEKAISDQKALYTFLKTEAGKKGKKKKEFNSVLAKGFEWKKGDVLIWIYLQSDFGIKQSGDPFDISLMWKYKE